MIARLAGSVSSSSSPEKIGQWLFDADQVPSIDRDTDQDGHDRLGRRFEIGQPAGIGAVEVVLLDDFVVDRHQQAAQSRKPSGPGD